MLSLPMWMNLMLAIPVTVVSRANTQRQKAKEEGRKPLFSCGGVERRRRRRRRAREKMRKGEKGTEQKMQ